MHTWQVQEAKARLTKVMEEADAEPQLITRRGVPTTVIMSYAKYRELTGPKRSIVSIFRNSPLYGLELDLERDNSPMREIDL